MSPSARECRQNSAREGSGHRDEQHERQPPAAESSLQQQQNPDGSGDCDAERPRPCISLVGQWPQQLGVILHGELGIGDDPLDVGHHVPGVATADVEGHVHNACNGVPVNHSGRGDDAHFGDVPQPNVVAGRCVEHQLWDVGHALPDLRCSPDDDVEDLLLLEEVPDCHPGQQRGRRATNVAGFDAVLLGRFQVDLDLDSRFFHAQVHERIDHAVNLADGRIQLVGLLPQNRQVLAEHPHHQVFVHTGADLADPLLWVELDLAGEPRVPADRFADRRHCLVIGGVGLDGDPQLTGVDPDDLVGGDGPTHVGAHVLDAGDRAQLGTGLSHDPRHLRMRGAGRTVPLRSPTAVRAAVEVVPVCAGTAASLLRPAQARRPQRKPTGHCAMRVTAHGRIAGAATA